MIQNTDMSHNRLRRNSHFSDTVLDDTRAPLTTAMTISTSMSQGRVDPRISVNREVSSVGLGAEGSSRPEGGGRLRHDLGERIPMCGAGRQARRE